MTNYATKTDLKNVTHVDTSRFALKTNLPSLKTEFDKLDVGKLQTVPSDLAKLSNKVANDLIEKTEFNTLKTKVDGIDITKCVLKTKYDTEVGNLKLKVPDISELVQTSVFNSKITEVENKINNAEGKTPDIKNFASKIALKTAEKKYLILKI